MKVVKKGKKFKEITCPACEAILEYEGSDVKIETAPVNTTLSSASSTPLYNEWQYIICPECNHKIYIKETLIR